ncbi:MAG: phage tail protein [Motilibacteraceae bacterium]
MPASDMTALGGEPPVSAAFLLEVDGVPIGTFRSVRGLEVTLTVEEYAEGGTNGYVHQFPGQMRWPNLVFSRGLTQSDALFSWMQKSAGEGFQGAGGKLQRATASVTVLDFGGNRLRSYELSGAFPVRWSGPSLSVDESAPLTEELEVAHSGFSARNVS